MNSVIQAQQSDGRVDISFGIRSWDPVHIKVEEKQGSAFSTPIRFTAVNSTFYPFLLKVDFPVFENLSPKPAPRDISVTHGTNNLFTFSVHVPEQGYSYRYLYEYWLAPSDDSINEGYPYLIPVKPGKLVRAKSTLFGHISDSFAGEKGDTVYAMRRGLVTAVPIDENLNFRLSEHDCLEVMHHDGTYMIYRNLSKEAGFVSPGQIVFPGQPVGLLSDSLYLTVSLKKVSKIKNSLISLPVRYVNSRGEAVLFDELDGKERSVHPSEVITREMTGRERKRFGR
ncbi:MAG: hypothetical protein HPY62_01880 [Bacteroidales bacterium]|nr:hypothetical protein [Bacteroidales bacterium]